MVLLLPFYLVWIFLTIMAFYKGQILIGCIMAGLIVLYTILISIKSAIDDKRLNAMEQKNDK